MLQYQASQHLSLKIAKNGWQYHDLRNSKYDPFAALASFTWKRFVIFKSFFKIITILFHGKWLHILKKVDLYLSWSISLLVLLLLVYQLLITFTLDLMITNWLKIFSSWQNNLNDQNDVDDMYNVLDIHDTYRMRWEGGWDWHWKLQYCLISHCCLTSDWGWPGLTGAGTDW